MNIGITLGVYCGLIPPLKTKAPPKLDPSKLRKQGEIDFEKMTAEWIRNLAQTHKQPIEKTRAQVEASIDFSDSDSIIANLDQALNDQNWDHPLFQRVHEKNDLTLAYAMQAVKAGKLSRHQYATLNFYIQAVQASQGRVRKVDLFDESKINYSAERYIKKTLQPVTDSNIAGILTDKTQAHLDPEQLTLFFKKMRDLPRSEQQFFIIPEEEDFCDGERKTITEELYMNSSFNIFGVFEEGGKKWRMVPSLGMMQTFLNVKFKHPVELVEEIDLSSEDGMRVKTFLNQRPIAVGAHGAEPSETADYFWAPKFKLPYHDFFHAFVVSNIKPEHRDAFQWIEKLLAELEIDPDLNFFKEYIHTVRERLVDLDLTLYRYDLINSQELQKNLDVVFWQSLGRSHEAAISYLVYAQVKDLNLEGWDAQDEVDKRIQQIKQLLAKGPYLKKLAQKLYQSKTFLEELSGINYKALAVAAKEKVKGIAAECDPNWSEEEALSFIAHACQSDVVARLSQYLNVNK